MAIPKNVIGPGSGTDKTEQMPPLTDDEVAGLMQGTKAIYVFGEIIYKDVFGSDWHTKYQLFHDNTCGLLDGNGVLRVCEDGNYAT